jgi:hypothetical protein
MVQGGREMKNNSHTYSIFFIFKMYNSEIELTILANEESKRIKSIDRIL